MKLRNSCVLAAGALFLATAGVTVVATPAAATPAAVATTASESKPRGDRDYREGYRDGYKAGWNQAREECDDNRDNLRSLRYGDSDYAEGFDNGWRRGYDRGFREFCRHHRY